MFRIRNKEYALIDDLISDTKGSSRQQDVVTLIGEKVEISSHNEIAGFTFQATNTCLILSGSLTFKDVTFIGCSIEVEGKTSFKGSSIRFSLCELRSVDEEADDIYFHFEKALDVKFVNVQMYLRCLFTKCTNVRIEDSSFSGSSVKLERVLLEVSDCSSIGITKTKFINCYQAISIDRNETALLEDLGIQDSIYGMRFRLVQAVALDGVVFNSVENCLQSRESTVILKKTKFISGKQRAIKVGVQLEDTKFQIRQSLFQRCDIGILAEECGHKDNKVTLCIFNENNVSMDVHSSKVEIKLSSFIHSKQSCLEYSSKNNILCEMNNFIEGEMSISKVKLIHDKMRFEGSTDVDMTLSKKNLIARLQKAEVLNKLYKKEAYEEVTFIIQSISIMFKVLKKQKLRENILESISNQVHVGYFAATREGKKGTLYSLEEIIESWKSLKNLSSIDNVVAILRGNKYVGVEHIVFFRKLRSDILQSIKPYKIYSYSTQIKNQNPVAAIECILGVNNDRTMFQSLLGVSSIKDVWIRDEIMRVLTDKFGFHTRSTSEFEHINVKHLLLQCKIVTGENLEEVQITDAELLIYKKYNDTKLDTANMLKEMLSVTMTKTLRSQVFHVIIQRILEDLSTIEEFCKILRLLVSFESGLPNMISNRQIPRNGYFQQRVSMTKDDIEFSHSLQRQLTDGFFSRNSYLTFDFIMDDVCLGCNEFFLKDELIHISSCSEKSHIFCKSCLKVSLSNTRYGCPGKSCDGFLSLRELESIGCTDSDMKNFSHIIFEKILVHQKTEWHKCQNPSCLGGATSVQDGLAFTCLICGKLNIVLIPKSIETLGINIRLANLWLAVFRGAVAECKFPEFYFPQEFMPEVLLDERKNMNFSALRKFTDNLPSTPQEIILSKNETVIPFLQYVIGTTPYSIRSLNDPPNILYHMKTNSCHRLVVERGEWYQCQSPQDEEVEFQKLKQKHGSFYAFHGSPWYNWYNILRTGIKLMSGTVYRLHGGKGIYCALDLSISLGYCRSRLANSSQGFAIIEVIDLKPNQGYRDVRVPQRESHVQLRFFCRIVPNNSIPLN